MTDLRTAAQQALEALQWHYRQGHSNTLGGFRLKIDEKALRELSAALAQQAEPAQAQRCRAEPRSDGDYACDCKIGACPGRSAEPAQQAEPLNLSDRAVQRRLAAQWGYVPAAAQAEPVEPVAWECKAGGLKPLTQRQYDAQTAATKRHYTRIAPPQHEALQNTKHYEAPPGFVLNPDYLVPELRAQRDALLEALKVAEPYLRHADVDYNVYVQCRAAIALVEGRVKAVEEGK